MYTHFPKDEASQFDHGAAKQNRPQTKKVRRGNLHQHDLHHGLKKTVALLLIWALLLTTLPPTLYAQEAEPTPPVNQGAETMTETLYLPLISQGIVTESANLDFDSPDFDSAVDNSELESIDAEVEEAEIEAATYDPDELEMVHAAWDGAGGLIDSSEDYQALGYPDARKIVRNSQGNLYVAYRKKQNSNYRIFVAESTDDGTTWQPLGTGPVEAVGAYTQRVPAIAIDEEDRLHLVWYGNDADNTGNEREIKYIRSSSTSDGSVSWTAWRNLYDGQNYDGRSFWQEHPTITIWGNTVHVVWESAERGLGEIKYISSSDGGATWGDVTIIQPSTQIYFSRPAIQVSMVDGSPNLFVVSYGSKSGKARLYYSTSKDEGASWSKWSSVAAAGADQRHASMTVDNDGKIHIVWRQVRSKWTYLRYRVYDPAKRRGKGGWDGGARTLASVRRTCLFFPSIAVGNDGSTWAVWTQSDDCASVPKDSPLSGQIFMSSSPPTKKKWSKPVALTTAGTHLYASLRTATPPSTSNGNVDVVWLDGTTSTIDGDELACDNDSCLLRHISLGTWN